MKVYIAVDEHNIVRCLASERSNIHKDKEHLSIHYVDNKGIVGDEYDSEIDKWTSKPENYPPPSQEEIAETKIGKEMRKIAIDNLKARGELPADYVDKIKRGGE